MVATNVKPMMTDAASEVMVRRDIANPFLARSVPITFLSVRSSSNSRVHAFVRADAQRAYFAPDYGTSETPTPEGKSAWCSQHFATTEQALGSIKAQQGFFLIPRNMLIQPASRAAWVHEGRPSVTGVPRTGIL